MPAENQSFPYKYPLTSIHGRVIFEISSPSECVRVKNFGNEAAFTQAILENLHPDDIFFDIGACVGVVSLFAAQRVAQVYAFEADPFYAGRLQNNIDINLLANIQVLPWAVSNEDGVVKFYTSGQAGDHSPSLAPLAYSNFVEVQGRAIDPAIHSGELPNPTAIKIDIEGAEYAALSGMTALLHSRLAPRIIFIEIHPEFLPKFGASIKHIMDVLAGSGYQIVYRQQRANQYHLILEKNPQPAPKTGQKTILFVPSNDTHASWMLPIAAGFNHPDEPFHSQFMILPKRSERASEALEAGGLNYYHYAPGLLRCLAPAAIVLGNDWGPDELTIIGEARLLHIPMICIQEGPLLFDPLQKQIGHADYALLQGPVMKQYVDNPQVMIVGNPKYEQITPTPLPEKPRVMINCNFTYGVFEDQRDSWVSAAVNACQELGLDFFVSQHPRDRGLLPDSYRVIHSQAALVPEQLQSSMILLTRFSTLIYEAIKMGRQVVYYDPMDEPYPLIKANNNGAVFYAQDASQLKDCLQAACNPPAGHARLVEDFMAGHCGDGGASQNCIRAIGEIAGNPRTLVTPDLAAYQRYCDLAAELEHQERISEELWNATQELRSGNQWLEGQRQAWEDQANLRQEHIGGLQNQIAGLQKNVVSLEEEIIDWRFLGLTQFLKHYTRRKWGRLINKIGIQK